MFFVLVQAAVGAFLLHLGVVGECRMGWQAELAGRPCVWRDESRRCRPRPSNGLPWRCWRGRAGQLSRTFRAGHGALRQGRIGPILTGLCDMHIHILGLRHLHGVSPNLARATGHRVTGCDANVYPPMSDQLRGAGVDLIEGYGPDQLALKPDCLCRRQCHIPGNPLLEAILDQGLAYVSGPSGWPRTCPQRGAGCWGGGYPRQDDDQFDARLDIGMPASNRAS